MVQNLKTYYDEISKGLKSSPEKQKNVLEDLQNSVNNFLAENSNATIEDVHEHFGSPQTIIRDNTDKVYNKKRVFSKRIIKTLLIIGAAVLVIGGVFGIIAIIDGSKSNQGHFSDGAGVEESMIHDDSWTTTAPDA